MTKEPIDSSGNLSVRWYLGTVALWAEQASDGFSFFLLFARLLFGSQ